MWRGSTSCRYDWISPDLNSVKKNAERREGGREEQRQVQISEGVREGGRREGRCVKGVEER